MKFTEPRVTTDPFGSVTTLEEGGQLGQYKDSQWSGTIRIGRETLNHEDMVRDLVQRAVKEGYIYPVGVTTPFGSASFTHLSQDPKDDNLWHFVVTRSYLD